MKKYNQPMQEQMKGKNFGKTKDHPLVKKLSKHFKEDEKQGKDIDNLKEEEKREDKQEGMSKDSRKKMAIMVLKKKMK